jgi:hypothetical protein
MSLPSDASGDGRPADDEGRSFTTGIGSMVAPTADEEDEETAPPPPRPTFTARSSGPEATPVPEQATAPDDMTEPDDPAEPETTVPTAPVLGPDDGAETDDGTETDDLAEPETTVPAASVLGPDDGITAEPDGVPYAGPASPADPVSVDEAPAWERPLTTAADLDEPLLSDATGLRARWQQAQAGFVDDPREAVGDAADLIEQAAQALVGALRQRQRQLRVMWESGPAGATAAADGASAAGGEDTEHLRLMMQRYRALFNQLCRP